MSTKWIDCTWPLREGVTTWPGQVDYERRKSSDMHCGDDATVSNITLACHTGTHTDGLNHFVPGMAGVEAAPLSALIGRVRVAHIPTSNHITAAEIEAYEQRTRPLAKGDRIVFRTNNTGEDYTMQPFREDYVAVSLEAARYLTAQGVIFVGVDYYSVGPYSDPAPTHRELLSHHVWVTEGLDLRMVEEGEYDMVCLPLKLEGSDGAPTRVVLKPVR